MAPARSQAQFCRAFRRLPPGRTVAVDALFGLARRATLAGTPATEPAAIAVVRAAFERAGRKVSVIRDSSGLVAPRIAAQIVNTAAEIAQQRIATPADIESCGRARARLSDRSATLGDRLGAATVLRILEEVQSATGDPRYRPSSRRHQVIVRIWHGWTNPRMPTPTRFC